jgi:hypothetical protein
MRFVDTEKDSEAIKLREGWLTVTPLGLNLHHVTAGDALKGWKLFKT